MNRRDRVLAAGGVVGPVAFVAAWTVCGAVTDGYSPVQDAISDLAAVGAPTRVAMTAGFVVFGIGVIAFGFALRAALHSRAWIAAIGTGACTIGVAATPLGGWSGDIPELPANHVLLRNRRVTGVDWGGWVSRNPEANQQMVRDVFAMIVSGRLRPVEPVSYPFEDAARALADQQQRRVVGKAVLVP